ncbi:unnamed protein product, partial [Medioppia subpectinata]
MGEFDWLSWDQIQRQIDINLLGTMRVIKTLLPLIIQSKGRVINVSSVNGNCAYPGISVYCATKYAIEGLSDALRLELCKFGVKVIVVRPGDYAKLTNLMAGHSANADQMWRLMDDQKRQLYGQYFHDYHQSVELNSGLTSPVSYTASTLCQDFEEAVLAVDPRPYITSASLLFRFCIQLIQTKDVKMSADTVESGSYEFALILDKMLATDSKNLVFSPFSLLTAMSMTLMGARNTCGDELSQVLFGKKIDGNQYPALAKDYQRLVDSIFKSNAQVLSSANFLYAHKQYPILKEYQHLIEQSFGAKSREVDFEQHGKEAVDTINGDINAATRGKIRKLFDDIDPTTKMVLANALYFKGLWKTKFKKENTKSRKFTTSKKKEIDVDFMHQVLKVPFGYSDELKASAIELSYDKSNVVLVIVLPEATTSLPELKAHLNGQTLDQFLKQLSPTKIDIYLPKFKLDSTLPLIPILSQMGIKQIFDAKMANFSGITNDPIGLYVGEVLQKAVIEVNEDGTEAAAATGNSLSLSL